MAIESHMRELDAKHRDLDAHIRQELLRPGVDWQAVATLKRMKLRLKEQLERLKRTRH